MIEIEPDDPPFGLPDFLALAVMVAVACGAMAWLLRTFGTF